MRSGYSVVGFDAAVSLGTFRRTRGTAFFSLPRQLRNYFAKFGNRVPEFTGSRGIKVLSFSSLLLKP